MNNPVYKASGVLVTTLLKPACRRWQVPVVTSTPGLFGTGILILTLLATSVSAFAETVYVSDRLEAGLRRGEGNEFRILRMLRSGDALEKLEESSTGYSKVRTSGGTEGWILTRYLMDQPAARERLDTISSENQKLRQTIARLESEIVELQGVSQEQSSQIGNLESEKQQLDTELSGIREATADVISIKRKNGELGKQVQQLSREKEELATENRAYRDNTRQDWFIRGAGVVVLGILIGLILPKLRRRRRWGEL